jgi:uncharacterized protein YcgI (DUF1989 family)
MDVIVLISACPQVNNPCNGFKPTPLQAVIWPPDAWPSNAGPRL